MENYGFWEKLGACLKKGGEERQEAGEKSGVNHQFFEGGTYYV
jgi:hypothetical protein